MAPKDPVRVVVESVSPIVDGGRFALKRVVGETLEIEADVFADGHDEVRAALWVRAPGGTTTSEISMSALVNDRFVGRVPLNQVGRWSISVVGWVDRFASWLDGAHKKHEVGELTKTDLAVGAELVGMATNHALANDRAAMSRLAKRLKSGDLSVLAKPELEQLMRRWASREPIGRFGEVIHVEVERARAAHGAWYEFFPRSTSPTLQRPGTLADATKHLEYVADMGFDVVYLPPIHPIGTTFRKGPNNTTKSEPDDPGSPWGIGSDQGGHTAIHPELGTMDDFGAFVRTAASLNLEVALDLAFQCSPDHPWVSQHPEWFKHRPDGTIQYAENPPKKYQDIYPLDFETAAWPELWGALADVVRFWVAAGITIFRVDNPHTKPFRFWEWLITTIRSETPEVIFLAEAFTRPKVMYHLAKLGFSQSYTYFAWRYSAWELRDYFTELSSSPVVDFFRPNAWPNTPDILTEQLQTGGRPAFIQRLVLAATLSANYGIYGPAFELVETQAAALGSEEYLNSEKYQQRVWDYDAPYNLRGVIKRVNQIRRDHPALQQLRNLHFHQSSNEALLAYSKRDDNSGDVVLMVVNTDSFHTQAGVISLDFDQLNVDANQPFEVVDLLGAETYHWSGADNYVELRPHVSPAHILIFRQLSAGSETGVNAK